MSSKNQMMHFGLISPVDLHEFNYIRLVKKGEGESLDLPSPLSNLPRPL